MESSPTLQDFVLNLIYDPDARSAFELDPHGTLEAAGLGDITAADVQDVLPLVLDYAPLGAAPSLDGLTQVDDVTTGVAHLDVAGAVAQLQTITTQLGGTTTHPVGDLSFAAAGTVTAAADNLFSGATATGGLFGYADLGLTGGTGVGGLEVTHDPAAGLDAAVTAPVEHAVTDVTYSADGVVSHATVTGTLDATVNSLTGLTGSLGADLDVSGVHEATSSLTGSLTGADHLGGGLLPDGSMVDGATAVIDHHVSTVTGLAGGLTHATEPVPEAGHDLLGGLGLHF